MKWESVFFLFLGAVSGAFIALVILPDIKRSGEKTNPSVPEYLAVPNSTETSFWAGDEYLRILQSAGGDGGGRGDMPSPASSLERLKKLYTLSSIPVWTFSNREDGLYLRQGYLNGKPDSWWNWSITLGDTVVVGSHLVQLAGEGCRAGGRAEEDLRMGLVAALRAGARLLAGNPQLVTGLAGIFWGEKAEEVLAACPSLAGDKEVRLALQEYVQLCTVKPGIEWETIVLPALVPGYQASIDARAIEKMSKTAEELKGKLREFLLPIGEVDGRSGN